MQTGGGREGEPITSGAAHVPVVHGEIDLEEFRRKLVVQTDARTQHIRQENNAAIHSLSVAVQGHLGFTREQVTRLGEQLKTGSART